MSRECARILQRPFPPYAYLPGKFPHPVRDPDGHSHAPAKALAIDPDALAWGMDLFNHGYYWEAHEAWEPSWRAAQPGPWRQVLKGLILLAAAGVKLREKKHEAARRHGRRAAALLRTSMAVSDQFEAIFGVLPPVLAAHVETEVAMMPSEPDQMIVFKFILGVGFPGTPEKEM